MKPVTVIKLDPQGRETWRYAAQLTRQDEHAVWLEASFDRDDTEVGGLPIQRGDLFKEVYYTDRWYNLFEIHAREDNHLRGWYCNVGCPATVDGDTIRYVDLALDLVVFPDGRQVVMDEDEFAALEIPAETRIRARAALEELQILFHESKI